MRSAALVALCAWVLALAPRAASASDPSGPLVKPIEQAKADQVRRSLDLSLGGPGNYYLTPKQLRILVGGPFRTNGRGEALETVVIRAPQGVREPPPGASIPFGVAGIVWGIRHPTQAWRLLLPVLD